MLAFRLLYAVAVTGLVVWALQSGQPLGAVCFVVVGVWLRQALESGRLARFGPRF